MARADRDRMKIEQEQDAYMVQFHKSNGSYVDRDPSSGFANVVGARLSNDEIDRTQDRIVEFLQNAQTADDALRKLSELGGYAQSDLIAVAIRVQRVTALHVADLERAIADLRAAQPADPTGAHPYRSGQRTASRRPAGGAPARPSTTGRPASRPGALRRVYGALNRHGVALCIGGFFVGAGVWRAL